MVEKSGWQFDEASLPPALARLSAERTKRAMELRVKGVSENCIREELARTLPYEGLLIPFAEKYDVEDED